MDDSQEALATRLLRRLETLEADRANFESVWQEILDYVLPRRADIYGSIVPGTKRGQQIYDSTPNKSLMRLASALNSMLTNPASKWFDLQIPGLEDPDDEVKEWLEDVRRVTSQELDNSNFYSQAHELYLDLASLGTSVMYIAESNQPDQTLYFKTLHLREAFISENAEEVVDTVHRRFEKTVAQMVEEYGLENLPNEVKEKYENPATIDEMQPLIHIVLPRRDYAYTGTPDPPSKKKYASITIHRATKHIIKESGYDTFPYVTPRWLKSSGEIYGRSPAWDALADIKTLNAMEKTMLRMGQKLADPPIQMPSEGFIRTVDLTPSGVNYYDSTVDARIEPILLGGNMPLARDMLEDKRTAIKDAFFDNNLHLIDKREMTAQEVQQRSSENMRVLGPTFSRLEYEYLEGTVERVIPILSKAGKLPDPPASIRDMEMKVKFVSPIAKAQRLHEVQAIEHTVGVAIKSAMEAQKPEILDNIDFDAALRLVADLNGTPMEIMQREENIAKMRKFRAEQAKAQQDIERQNIQADSAQKLGTAYDKTQGGQPAAETQGAE